MRRSLVAALMAALLVVALAGCGKKAKPEAPGEDRYPREYPTS
ncbi:MAG: hypothetical protein ACE5JZ_06390 [Kiloniellales bacterium]